jgi:hypothetical protein
MQCVREIPAWSLRLGGTRRHTNTQSRRLITRRSQVQILPPLLERALETGPFRSRVGGVPALRQAFLLRSLPSQHAVRRRERGLLPSHRERCGGKVSEDGHESSGRHAGRPRASSIRRASSGRHRPANASAQIPSCGTLSASRKPAAAITADAPVKAAQAMRLLVRPAACRLAVPATPWG